MPSWAQQVWTDHSRLLPDQLRGLPTAIMIWHDPSPVYPELNTDTVNYKAKYIWKHSTFVSTGLSGLEVVAAGSFIWFAENGWLRNVQLSKDDFAQEFNCANGILKPNKTYAFSKNYRFGDKIYAGDALWFVIAKDKNGKLYKGFALVETEGTLKN
jgi:hypothetical protein